MSADARIGVIMLAVDRLFGEAKTVRDQQIAAGELRDATADEVLDWAHTSFEAICDDREHTTTEFPIHFLLVYGMRPNGRLAIDEVPRSLTEMLSATPAQKTLLTQILRRAVQASGAQAIIQFAEAWVVIGPGANDDIAPSEHPDRGEGIIAIVDSASLDIQRLFTSRIMDGKVVERTPRTVADDDPSKGAPGGGRFAGLSRAEEDV